jgi:hypothetical protein
MPRLRFIEDREFDAGRRALTASAERTGACELNPALAEKT